MPGPVRAQSPKAQPSRSLPEVSGQCHDRGVLGVSAIAADSCKKKSSDLLHLLPDRQGLSRLWRGKTILSLMHHTVQ